VALGDPRQRFGLGVAGHLHEFRPGREAPEEVAWMKISAGGNNTLPQDLLTKEDVKT
jgi:hypothetical protein